MKIGQKLIFGFLVIAALIAVVGNISVNRSKKALEKAIGENSVFLASEVLDKIDRFIYDRIEELEIYAKDVAEEEGLISSNQEFAEIENVQGYIDRIDKEWTSTPKDTVTPFMQGLIDSLFPQELREELELKEFYKNRYGYEVFKEVFYTNRFGANVAQTQKTSDYYQADEEWWQRAREDGVYVHDISYDESAGVYSIDICVRIDDKVGNFLGVIKAVVNIKDVFNIISELEPKSDTETLKSTHFKLLDKDGRLIYSTKPSFIFFEDLSGMEIFKKHYAADEAYIIAKGDEPGEEEELFAHAHSKGYKGYKGLDWGLIVEHDIDEIFAPVYKLRRALITFSLVVTLLAILIGILISNSILRPIKRLIQATVKIGKGKLDTKIELRSKDEIGSLAASFNKMTEDLQRTTTSIDRLNKEIAERKKTEEQLIQAEKMAALGTLSAGMAHEINNPLMGSMLLTQSLSSKKKKGSEEQKTLLQIEGGLRRVSNVVSKLLAFSRKEKLVFKKERINDVIDQAIPLISHEFNLNKIVLEKDYGKNLPSAELSNNAFQQALINILLNAKDALLSSTNKEVTISTYSENNMIKLRIKDQGCGIKKENLKKVFDPFYTSKPVGKGLGMGMSIVRTIMDQHNGRIEINSEEGRGTEVILSFPI